MILLLTLVSLVYTIDTCITMDSSTKSTFCLDGGRDMRSFSGLYYVMIILLLLYSTLQIQRSHISEWLYYAFIFLSCALLIIIARPYKQKYMNISDTLLVYAAVVYMLLSRHPFANKEM